MVLTDFDKWLKTKKQELGCQFRPQNTSTAIFVTWTDWDISQCLWNECKRKKLPVPSDMLNRIDLKALFKVRFCCIRFLIIMKSLVCDQVRPTSSFPTALFTYFDPKPGVCAFPHQSAATSRTPNLGSSNREF